MLVSFHAKQQNAAGLIENASAKWKLLIGSLMDIVQQVFMAKLHFEKHGKAVMIASFGSFAYQ